MGSISKVLVGFFAGILVYHYLVDQTTPTSDRREPSSVAPIQEEKLPEAGLEHPSTSEGSLSKTEAGAKRPTVERSRQMLEITLSEELVTLLEREWNDLPLQAEAAREPRGWRLVRIQPDSHLFRSGLRDGDLITTEFLDRLRAAQNGGAGLALRVEHILNRITR